MELKNIVELLVEQIISEVAEAPENAPFGNFLFAPRRDDLTPDEQKEQNTKIEQEFFNALKDHYSGRDSEGLGMLAKKLLSVKQKGWYSKILTPVNEIVYRFLTKVSVYKAAKIVNSTRQYLVGEPITKKNIEDYNKGDGNNINSITNITNHGPGILHPDRDSAFSYGIQSWSANLILDWIIDDLDAPSLGPKESAIVIAAKTNNNKNFFLNPSGIEKVNSLPSFAY